MRGGLHDRFRTLLSFHGIGEFGGVFHEDTGAYEYGFGSQLHHERGVGWSCDSSGGEIGDGQLAVSRHHLDEFVRSLMLFGFGVELFFAEHGENPHLLHDLANVADGMDYVPGASFAFRANHGCAFGDAAQSFSEIAGAADEGNTEGLFIDVMDLVGRGENFGLVDVIDAQLLQDLRLCKVADAALGHDGNVDHRHDFANLFRRGHTRHSAFGANLRRNPLQGHYGDGPGALGNFGLLGVGDVHDHAALEHFGKAGFQTEAGGVVAIILRHRFTLSCSREG